MNYELYLLKIIILILFLSIFTNIKAQNKDSIISRDNNHKSESINLKPESEKKTVDSLKNKKHSPRKATLMSAVVPGLGQAYNKKYWKMPIIYAGTAAVVYFVKFNHSKYINYKTAYGKRIDNNPLTMDQYVEIYSDANLLELKNYYRRNLELTYILGGLLYILNVLDATVDANLFDYNINEDLSLNVKPLLLNNQNYSLNYLGFTLTYKIKN